MPPKVQKESKKTEQKRQDKIIEDKTFGLKNKNKSKAVQSYVKSVAAQVKGQVGKGGESKRVADEFAAKAAQKKDEEKKALLASLFKTIKKTQEVVEDEVEEEVQEENYEEIDLYTDQREQIFGRSDEPNEELENWRANKDKTDKICKYFLDSVEAGKYGWRWTCPNGIQCIYKHALPYGYTLKRDMQTEEKKDDMTLEERLEADRQQLSGGTPVTLERFLKWKEDKKIQREKESEKKRVDEAKKSGGKGLNVLSGRALFTYDPSLFQDDAEALDDKEYEEEENREEEEQKNEEVPEEDEEDEEDEAEGEDQEEEQIKVEEGEAGEQAGEIKKKKKKSKKKAAEDDDVKINEDVFLGEEDVELPEDDS